MAPTSERSGASPSQQMEELLDAHFLVQCIHVAAVLGLADLIGDGRKTAEALATATGAHAVNIKRLLRALASKGVLSETGDGQFQLTALGRTLRSDAPDSLRDKAIFETSAPLWAATGGLFDTVHQGQPTFPRLHDVSIYQYLAENPELGAVFNRYMTAQSGLHNAAIVEAYDFGGARTVVDIGGGLGATLAAILTRYPDLNSILFELPEVAAGASFDVFGVADRCEARGGDMMTAVPDGGDIYIIKRVMMDKTDEDAVTVLQNCGDAMPAGGKVLVIDPMLPEPNTPHHNWFSDVLMMILTHGRCRTEHQFRALFDTAGFELTRVIGTKSTNVILEGVKR